MFDKPDGETGIVPVSLSAWTGHAVLLPWNEPEKRDA
jgi:hypothetical protein